MTQIIEISTQYQLANISALIRSGRLGEARLAASAMMDRVASSWWRTIPSPRS
jgi:hypothetical protein